MGRAIWVSVLTVAVVAGSAAAETLHAEHRFDATTGASLLVDVSFHDVEVQAVAGASSVEVAVDLEVDETFHQRPPRARSAARVTARRVRTLTSSSR